MYDQHSSTLKNMIFTPVNENNKLVRILWTCFLKSGKCFPCVWSPDIANIINFISVVGSEPGILPRLPALECPSSLLSMFMPLVMQFIALISSLPPWFLSSKTLLWLLQQLWLHDTLSQSKRRLEWLISVTDLLTMFWRTQRLRIAAPERQIHFFYLLTDWSAMTGGKRTP